MKKYERLFIDLIQAQNDVITASVNELDSCNFKDSFEEAWEN